MPRALLTFQSSCLSLVIATMFAVSPLYARVTGQALSINANVFGTRVEIKLFNFEIAEADGGATLFASSSPGGAILARVPLPPPYEFDPDVKIVEFFFNGVPPGTYYLVMVSGNVGAPTVPASAWTRFVVSGGCGAAPPGIGSVARDTGEAPGTVQLFLASGNGCASTFDLEVGTTPGGRELGTVSNLGQVLIAATPPAGQYYVRVRGRNAFGVGPYSNVLPIPIPNCVAQWEPATSSALMVAGNNVTLSWTPAPGTPPLTFHELWLFHARIGNQDIPTLLLPGGLTSVSGNVPAGSYNISVLGGNACGKVPMASFIFTVP